MADPVSLHKSVLDAVVAALQAIESPRVPPEQIYLRKTVGDVANVMRPCWIVSLDDARETMDAFSTEDDCRTLPVVATFLDRKDRKNTADIPGWLASRQQVANAFLMQLLPDVLEVWHVDVRPLDVLDMQRVMGPGYEDAQGGFMFLPQAITTRIRPASVGHDAFWPLTPPT